MEKYKNSSSIIAAVGIIIIGCIFLMSNFNILWFELPKDLLTWKLIFVFIAFAKLARGKVFSSIFWVIVAAAFYFPNYLAQFSLNSVFDLWPLLLIALGLDLMLRNGRTLNKCKAN